MAFQKMIYSLLTIIISFLIIFSAIRVIPGDPVLKILGPQADQKEIESLRKELKIDLSYGEQLSLYLKEMAYGSLGKSLFKGKSVRELIALHFPPTLELAFSSIFFSALGGIFFGWISGLYHKRMPDSTIRILSLLCLSFPIFSLGPILVYIFSIKLGILPVSEWNGLSHRVLPVLTLSLPLGSIILKVTRNKYLEEFKSNWVQVLRAKGMSFINIELRILKVCLPSILNVIALQLSVVLAGTMITETIFDIPGMGLLLFDSIGDRDYPVVQGVILYSTFIYILIFIFTDFINSKLDPRIK